MSGMPDGGQSTCSFNPTAYDEVVDKAQDCTYAAAWHIRIWGAGADLDGIFSACVEHTPQAFTLDAGGGKRQFHEYGPGCGQPGGFWHEVFNVCTTLEVGLETGLLWYECTEALLPTAGLPLGTYARWQGRWWRVPLSGDHVWLASKPPPGWEPGRKTYTFPTEV